MRQTSSVVYLSIDELLPSRGHIVPGFEEFLEKLAHAAIPCVWLTSRTRLQIDEPRRKLGHRDPFIAEDGCGVFLPEDYFHLRPQTPHSGRRKQGKSKDMATIRLGRFTCLPVAEPQPAAAEALEALAQETGVSTVPLSSLPPRQLAQNTGLHSWEADLARQRDFDELFFFAGASGDRVAAFRQAAHAKKMQLRQQGMLWSLAAGADSAKCVRELAALYDRALHAHARTFGVAVGEEPEAFFSACDRRVLLSQKMPPELPPNETSKSGGVLRVPSNLAGSWERLADYVITHR